MRATQSITDRRKRTGPKGFVTAAILALIHSLFSRRKVTTDHLKKMDFVSSTQKIGARFTEKVRDNFRHKWLRKH